MLVLHIGTHKTGTSALQIFLSSHADKLETAGVRYLQSARNSKKAHHELSWAIRQRQGVELSVWDAVRSELNETPAPVKVISSEAFWFTDPAGVKAQLGDVQDLRIVLYLRRQDKYLQSLYKQSIASGRNLSFPQWRKRFHFRGDYLSVVRQWADQFGKDALVIRPYERGGRPVDTVSDFLGFLGVEMDDDMNRESAKRDNPTPRRELAEFLRALNHVDGDFDRGKLFLSIIGRDNAYIRSADLLDHDGCVALMEGFAEGNRTLIREFYRDSEPLFPEMTRIEPPEIWKPESEEYFAMTVDVLDAVWKAAKNGFEDC